MSTTTGDDGFNDEEDISNEEYHALVAGLSEQAAEELRQAKHSLEAQKSALCRYYKRGERVNLSTGELIDFLGVSTPSIIDKAGYNEEEGDALMQISDALRDEEVSSVDLPELDEPQTVTEQLSLFETQEEVF